ncbi:MAG: hypothetical protein SFY80_01130 [Verrucomicrobiota bacterium]|nr:hypothetical protein [Verrucomicrobiota bacterium]
MYYRSVHFEVVGLSRKDDSYESGEGEWQVVLVAVDRMDGNGLHGHADFCLLPPFRLSAYVPLYLCAYF